LTEFRFFDAEAVAEFECVVGNTLIYSKASATEIKHVKDTFHVLTHQGNFEKVSKTFKRYYSGPIVRIVTYYNGFPLCITPEHPVLAIRNVREPQTVTWRKNPCFSEPQWVPAEKLTSRDFLVFPRIKEQRDLQCVPIELAELLGWYISEGSLCYRDKHIAGVEFSFSHHERENIERVENLIRTCFPVEPKVYKTRTSSKVAFFSTIWSSIFEQLGATSNKKRIPHWLLLLQEEKQWAFLRGLIKGDGYVSKYFLSYATVSQQVALHLRLLLYRLGVLHSLKTSKRRAGKIEGRIVKSKYKIYSIVIAGDSARIVAEKVGLTYDGGERTTGNFGYVMDNYVLVPIKQIMHEVYNGMVYNLEVDGNQSYVTPHGIIHNCVVKHWSEARELLSEHSVTITATQLGEEKGDADDLFAKLLHVSSTKGDIEELVEEFFRQHLLCNVAVATKQMRVTKEDVAQMIMVIGNLALAEAHLEDYIKKYTAKLQRATTEKEQNSIREKIKSLSNFLFTARLIRKKYLTGFLGKIEQLVKETPTLPGASDHPDV